MKFSALQENLAEAISIASRSIAGKSQLPILSGVLIKAKKEGCLISGTDTTFTITTRCNGKIEEEGALVIPAKEFVAVVSSFPAGRVEVETKKEAILLRAGRMRATLVGMDAKDFPDVSYKNIKGIKIPSSSFSSALRQLLFAASSDEGRPVLTGVKMELKGGALHCTSTDGYRLSIVDIPVEENKEEKSEERPAIVPTRVLSEAARLAGKGESVVFLVSDGEVTIDCGGGQVSGRLLAGEFPKAERIIPKELDIQFSVNREELEQAARLAAVFARESANIVRWTISKKKLVVSANSPHIGENETEVEIGGGPSADGACGEIAFNSRYLLDWLGSVDKERVTFGMVNSLKPGVFKIEGDSSYLHIIMPVRVQK